MSPPIVQFDQVTAKISADFTLTNLSFQLKQHQFLAILGTSGSGKSTLIRLINRLIPFDTGELNVYGKSVANHNLVALRRSMGYVVQQDALFPHLTVLQNLSLLPNILGLERSTFHHRLEELLHLFSLSNELLKKHTSELSGGQVQRFNIIRSLIHKPRLVLMDEPFSALDSLTKEHIISQFEEVQRQWNLTTIMVTHSIKEAFELANKIILLNSGAITFCGSPIHLLKEEKNTFARNFIAKEKVSLEWTLLAKAFPELSKSSNSLEFNLNAHLSHRDKLYQTS